MQIIIEGYQYPAGSVDKVLWEGAFQTVDGKVSIGYVGYYWNDRLKDSVFVLPKVFLEPDADLGTHPLRALHLRLRHEDVLRVGHLSQAVGMVAVQMRQQHIVQV